MKVTIEQYLYMDHYAYRQMIKNKRNTIDITILPYDKYQGQTVKEIIKDLKQKEDEQNDRNNTIS